MGSLNRASTVHAGEVDDLEAVTLVLVLSLTICGHFRGWTTTCLFR